MKKILQLVLLGTKYTLIVFTLQVLTLTLVVASNSSAQEIKSVKEVKLSLEFKNSSLQEVISQVEALTAFRFIYYQEDLNQTYRLNLKRSKMTVADLLLQLSKDLKLAFKQNNNYITIKKLSDNQDQGESNLEIIIQGKQVTGKVISLDDEEALPGVNVIEKGTSNGTVTNINGEYSLEVSENAMLVFSSVGFTTEEIPLQGRSVIDLTMAPDIQQLQELVVVGYGSREKKDLTGSVSQITSKEIVQGSTMTPEMSMQGRMAGVFVSHPGVDPNARPTIRIRGVSTLGYNNPLFVVDGIPVSDNFNQETQNIFALINPNDIESISVLKDASATAIYGVRASNGVILIQTKRGESGKPRINLSATYGIQNIKERYDVLTTPEYIDFMREAQDNNTASNLDPKWRAFFDEDPNYPPGYYLGNETTTNDWQEPMLNKNAPVQDYNLSISGSNDVSNYYVSGGFANMASAYKGNNMDRYSIAVNSDHQLNDWLKLGETFRYAVTERDFPGTGNANSANVDMKWTTAPWMPVYSENGINGFTTSIRNADDGTLIENAYGPATADHPLGQLSMINKLATSSRALTSVYAEARIIDQLKIKGTLSYDLNTQQIETMVSENIGFFKTWGEPSADGHTFQDYNTSNSNLVKELSLLYNKNFGNHNVDVVLNAMDQHYNFKYMQGDQIHFPLFDWAIRGIQGAAPVENKNVQSFQKSYALQGYMGRISYNYDFKYYVDLTVRRDGTSRFAPGYQWGTFPSAAVAWRISAESFMQNYRWINDLKLRASWGQTGNQETREFSYISLVNINPSYATGPDNGNINAGAYMPDFPVEDLSWETVTSSSAGFDATLFNNKVNLTAEYYYRFTDDILQTADLTLSTGIPNSPRINLAQVSNQGVEFSLGYNDRFGDFGVNLSSNFTTTQNRVEKLYVDQPGGVEEGLPINYIYGYQMLGIFQTQAEVDAYKNEYQDNGKMAQLAPGDVIFADLNGPPAEGATGKEAFRSFEPDNLVNSYDQTYLGKTIPGYFYGFTAGADFKGFDFSITFRGVGDVQKVNWDRQRGEEMRGNGSNQWATIRNRWTPQNPSTTMPRAIFGDPSDNRRMSSRWVEDAGFLRMDNMQLGYTLPQNLLSKVKLSSGRVFLTAQNMFVLSPFTGIDPETLIPTTYKLGTNLSF